MEPDRSAQLSKYWDMKSEREAARDQDPNKQIHTDLLLRMIRRHVPVQRCRILDAGGGTGRFSILLARLGHDVTHVDISPEMLKIARAEAERNEVDLTFEQGNVTDLSRWSDRSFDAVLCLDAPVSFCHREFPAALDELARVAGRTLILSVFNRTGLMIPLGVEFDLIHFGKLKTVLQVNSHGNLDVTEELLNKRSTLMPSWHAFTPKEIVEELGKRKFKTSEVSAPGTMSRSVSKELLSKVITSDGYQDYLSFEETIDSQEGLLGVGSAVASGLAVVAHRAAFLHRITSIAGHSFS
jgi:ubiquinone/menaquinone biosynthesis C-methylase UbiE